MKPAPDPLQRNYETRHPGRVGAPSPRDDEIIVEEIRTSWDQVLRVTLVRNRDERVTNIANQYALGLRLFVRDPRGQMWPMRNLGFLLDPQRIPDLLKALTKAMNQTASDTTTTKETTP